MLTPSAGHQAELRSIITVFLMERRDSKLDKLAPDDLKRIELHQQFIHATWLDDAARRVGQIQAVTHSLKPVHPDAKGTNLYSPPHALSELSAVGSHCLGPDFTSDVVGNAAALDVYKFLKLEHQGRTLLALALSRDANLALALSDDPAQSELWMSAFAGLIEPRGRVASHTFAKQFYWLTGSDPHDDANFHLLAPLHASSLTHSVYLTIQDDRFSEEAKAARQARRDGAFHARTVHEYPQLAVQNLGGTKPQNISQLNSERRGDNFLLASLPPLSRASGLMPLLRVESMFEPYGRRPEVKKMVRALLNFLQADPIRNVETRRSLDHLIDALIDAFLQFSAELRLLLPGWSQEPECQLGSTQQHWLDADGVRQACVAAGLPLPTDTAERISEQFANWLNRQLRDPLPMDDVTFRHWRSVILEQIKEEERAGLYDN